MRNMLSNGNGEKKKTTGPRVPVAYAASYVPVPPLMMLLLARLHKNGCRNQVENHRIEEYGLKKS